MDDNYEFKDQCYVLTMSTLRLEGHLNVELKVCIRQCWKGHERCWCLGKIGHYTSHYQYSWDVHLHVPILSCAHIHPRVLCSNIWDSQHGLRGGKKKQYQQQNMTHHCEHITWLHVFIAYRI